MDKPIVMIGGRSDTGKTASLRNLTDPGKKLYLNFEGKQPPFPCKFVQQPITDPYTLHKLSLQLIEHGTAKFDTLIIDSISACMGLYSTKYIGKNCENKMAGWGNYGSFYEKWANEMLPLLPQTVIVLAHIDAYEDEDTMRTYTQAVVQGKLKRIGLEADFGVVANTVVMPTDELKDFNSPFLNVTEEDELEGFKHVIQTRKTLETKDTKIRSPIGPPVFWEKDETFIDSDVQIILDRYNQYYK